MDFDVDSIKTRLMNRLRAKASWSTVLFFSTNQRLLDAVSEELAELAKYKDYLITERKWSKAQNRSSLLTHNQMLRYDAHRKVGAVGTIRVSTSPTFNAVPAKNVPFPKWSVFTNGEDLKVASVSAEVLTTADNYIDIPVVQGIPKTSITIAQGDLYEEIIVDNASFENVYYEIYVNSVLWTEVEDLRLAASGTAQVYEVENIVDGSGVILRFGNDIFGKKLVVGDSVEVRYIETLGADGNVTAEDIITTVESSIRDIDGDLVTIYCTNVATVDGGVDNEDIEEIRVRAPSIFQTGDRAGSSLDYKALLLLNPIVQNVTVWGAYETNLDAGTPGAFIPSEENVVHISGFTAGGTQFTALQKTTLTEFLEPYKSPTEIMQFTDAEFLWLVFNTTAYVKDRSLSLSTVKNAIVQALTDEYALENMDFTQKINQSDYQAFIDNLEIDGVPIVDYHNTLVDVYYTAAFNSAYQATITIPLFPVEPGSVRVYVKTTGAYTHIGTDNGVGGFTAQPTYNLTGSSINYSTGGGSLIVAAGLASPFADYTIKFVFKNAEATFSNNLVPTNRKQIFRFAEANVTTLYST